MASIGSKAAGAAFKDPWTLRDVGAEWIHLIEAKHLALYRVILAAMTDSDKSYLTCMAARLIEMRVPEPDREHLPALRPDYEPLLETAVLTTESLAPHPYRLRITAAGFGPLTNRQLSPRLPSL